MIEVPRKISPQEMYGAKKLIIRLYKQGRKTSEIKEITGICINTVRATIHKYKIGGMEALKPQKEGRKNGTCMTLTVEQSKWIQRAIVDKYPDQLKLPFGLWTRKAVQELIRQQYGIEMPIRTVGSYLERWGYTPQRPQKRARQQSSKAVQAWLEEEYPQIKREAQKENATIYWMDETAVQNCSNLVRGYSPKGQTPTLELETKKMHINMVSAITGKGGKVYFKIYEEAMNAELMKEFSERLIKENGDSKVYLICDNLRVHHSHVYSDWVEEHKNQISVFYLPSYSPEYNPDEYLNNDLKQNIALKPQAKNEQDIRNNTEAFMHSLEENPDHVCKYFDHDKLKSY